MQGGGFGLKQLHAKGEAIDKSLCFGHLFEIFETCQFFLIACFFMQYS